MNPEIRAKLIKNLKKFGESGMIVESRMIVEVNGELRAKLAEEMIHW